MPISAAEVTNVSPHGLWILLGERECFAPFTDFPWFRDATIAQLTQVEWPSPNHLYWPALDIDLAVDSLAHPAAYPLMSRSGSNARVAEDAAKHKPSP
ncbi:MAG TPA: DUF2442 domain-containing protein [Gemmatimonadales bacterium]|jgi:hypothetical protein|nr:DUF2442 domain-containing protein [Gemmatimonadales bacterium]